MTLMTIRLVGSVHNQNPVVGMGTLTLSRHRIASAQSLRRPGQL